MNYDDLIEVKLPDFDNKIYFNTKRTEFILHDKNIFLNRIKLKPQFLADLLSWHAQYIKNESKRNNS